MRLLMLGLDNAGKTTVVKKFNGEDIDLIAPTLGFNIKTLEYRGFKLNIWDVGGQTSLRSYWRNYFEQTDGLVWVVDSADRARLQDCKAELQVLLQQERLAGATLLVFANKQDIDGALSQEEIAKEVRPPTEPPRWTLCTKALVPPAPHTPVSVRLSRCSSASRRWRTRGATGTSRAAPPTLVPASRTASNGSSRTLRAGYTCTIRVVCVWVVDSRIKCIR